MQFKFTGLAVQNLVLFKAAQLDLAQPGIFAVRGLNRDSTIPNSNGAGKSLLFNTIPTLFFDAPPTATRRRSAKDLFGQQGKIELTAQVGKEQLRIGKYVKGKSLKLAIERNDEDLKFRTVAAAQAYLESCFPLSQELFYQLVYLRGTTANVLLNGTPTSRHAFFEKIFHLEDYDRVAQALRKRLKALREYQIEHDTLKSTLTKPPKIKRIKRKLKQVNKSYRKYQTKLDKLEEQLAAAKLWKKFATQLPARYHQVATIEQVYQQAKRELKQLLRQNEKYQGNQRDWEKYRRYRKERRYYRSKARRADPKLLVGLKTRLRWLTGQLHEQEKIVRQHRQLEHQSGKRQEILVQAQQVRVRLGILRYQLHELKQDRCPLCSSKLDPGYRKGLERGFKAEEQRFAELWEDYQTKNRIKDKEWVFTGDPKKHQDYLDKLEKQVAKLERRIVKLAKGQHYHEQLDQLDPVDHPNVRLEAIDQQQLDRLRQRVTRYHHYTKLSRALAQLSRPKSPINALKTKISTMQRKLDSFRLEQQTLSQQLGQAEEQTRVYRKTKKKVAKLKQRLVHLPLITALVEAYGPKGLRGHDVHELVSLYVKNLNQFSSLVFSEPVDFSCEINKRSLQIFGTRNKRTWEICHLSGAERQAFNLLSLLALLPLIPQQYRSNLLILDEIESNLSPQNRKLLATELLPRLQQLIPTIFVITPHSEREFFIPNAVTYQITRRNGRSKLEMISG